MELTGSSFSISYNPITMSYSPITFNPIKNVVIGIDGTETGSTLIVTTNPSDGKFYPLKVGFSLTAVSVPISVCTVSVGTNSTYNNILVATVLTGLTTLDDFLVFDISALTPSVAASTDIKVNVSVGAVATTYTFKVMLIGIYD